MAVPARVKQVLMGAALIALFVFLGFAVAPYINRSGKHLDNLHPGWMLAAIAAAFGSMAATARLQRRLLAAGGSKVSLPRMLGLTYQANALLQTVPGGTVLSAGYTFQRLKRWGLAPANAVFAIVISLALSLFAFGLLGFLGLLLLGDDAVSPTVLVTGALALAGAVVAVLAARRPETLSRLVVGTTRWSARVLRRDPTRTAARAAAIVAGLAQIHPRHRDWTAALLFASMSWAADLLCLFFAGHAVGAPAGLHLVAVAYFAGMGVSSLSVLPGGLGPVEVAMVLALSHGVTVEAATAAVVIYRLVSLVLVVAVGWALWLHTWTKDNLARRRAPEPLLAPDPEYCAS